eukprot:g14429.t1
MSSSKKLKLKNLNATRKKNRNKHVVKIEKVSTKNDMTVLGVARASSKATSGVNKKPGETSQPASPMQSFRILDDPFKVKVGVGWSLDDKDLSESRYKSSVTTEKLTHDFPTPGELEIKSPSTKNILTAAKQNSSIGAKSNPDHSRDDEPMQNTRPPAFPHRSSPGNIRVDPNQASAGSNYSNKPEVSKQGTWKRNTHRVATVGNNSAGISVRDERMDSWGRNGGRRKVNGHHYYRQGNKFLRTSNGRSSLRQSEEESPRMNKKFESEEIDFSKANLRSTKANRLDAGPTKLKHDQKEVEEAVEIDAEKYEKRNVQGKKIFDPKTGNMVNASDVARGSRESNRKPKGDNYTDNRKSNHANGVRRKERSSDRYNSKQSHKRHVSIDDEDERKRLEKKIETSMKNVVSPVDAEDEQDNSGGYRVPKVLERLKLMNKQKRSGRNSKGKVPRKIREENDGRQERKLHNKKPERKEKANRSTTVDTNKKVTKLKTSKTKKEPKSYDKRKRKKNDRGVKVQTKPTHDNCSSEVTHIDKSGTEIAGVDHVSHDIERLQEQDNSSMKKIKQNGRNSKVPKKVLKVWGSSESELELSDSNFSAESSPSWQSQPTWGSSGGGGYFDALFANGSTSPKGVSLMSPTNREYSAHKDIYQEDYLLSLNMMMGNMQFNNIGMLQKHSSKSGHFADPTLAKGNEKREKKSTNNDFNVTSASHQTSKPSDDDDDSNSNFDESKLIGTFLDSPKITTLRDTEDVGKDGLDL